MIDGITVLNDEVITEIPTWFTIIFIACVIIIGIAGLIYETCDISIAGFVIVASTIVLGASFVGAVCNEVPTNKHKYQVLISDDAKFKEIYDKYEIIKAEGEIYTIRDKEGLIVTI